MFPESLQTYLSIYLPVYGVHLVPFKITVQRRAWLNSRQRGIWDMFTTHRKTDRDRETHSDKTDRQTPVTLTHQWLTLITTNIQAETSWPIWSNSIEFSVVWEYHTAYVFFSKLVSSKTPIRFSALPASICNQELELKTPHKHQTLIISHQQNIRPMYIGHQIDSILSEPIKTHSQPSKEYLCCN